MVLVQINLSDEENKNVEVYKALNGFVTKEQTIKDMVKQFKPRYKK